MFRAQNDKPCRRRVCVVLNNLFQTGLLRRRPTATSPSRPAPSNGSAAGSGTTAVGVDSRKVAWPSSETSRPPLKPLLPMPPVLESQSVVIVLPPSVTPPVLARALPQPMLAPVFKVILVCARILPWKVVDVSSVAELGTCQKMPAPEPVLITLTAESGEVISELSI